MAVDNGLRKGENYPGTQEDFNNDITTLCVLCQDLMNDIVIDKGSEYEIINHNEKDQQKITFSICC